MEQDVRWKQRFANYLEALSQLSYAVEEVKDPSNLEKEGTIQRFEFTHELAWKVMKDFLEYEGIINIIGFRSAIREAFHKGLISNGQVWMDMLESRNRTVHTYQNEILEREYDLIKSHYYPLFIEFANTMKNFL